MSIRTTTSSRHSVRIGIELARLLELPEEEFAGRDKELEADVLFRRLLHAKVITVQPFSGATFAAQRLGGWGLRTESDGLPALLDAEGDLAHLLRTVGQSRFEECFLRDGGRTDEEIAQACRISALDAARLRKLVNRLYIQAEFEGPSASAAPAAVYSAVAGIAIEGGRPSLAFFNRQIWKGRYQIDEERRRKALGRLSMSEARRLDGFLRELGLLERRKSTLYQVLETMIEHQSRFLVTGKSAARRPLTQRELADRLVISPSVLNRLISNKSVQLPWGFQAPMKVLVPSRKSLIRDRLHDLLTASPDATDAEMRDRIDRLFGVVLSVRSVAQYRSELGLPNVRRRRKAPR